MLRTVEDANLFKFFSILVFFFNFSLKRSTPFVHRRAVKPFAVEQALFAVNTGTVCTGRWGLFSVRSLQQATLSAERLHSTLQPLERLRGEPCTGCVWINTSCLICRTITRSTDRTISLAFSHRPALRVCLFLDVTFLHMILDLQLRPDSLFIFSKLDFCLLSLVSFFLLYFARGDEKNFTKWRLIRRETYRETILKVTFILT